MLLPFPDSIIFAGYELARGQYYEDLGIKPSTQAVSGNSYTIQQLAAGQVPYALSGAPELIVAASKGHDLVSIAAVNKDMFAVDAPAGSGITSLEDLDGKKLGIVDVGDGAMPLVNAALADAGLTPNEDVELVVIGDGGPASAAAIKEGRVDAYAGSVVDMAVIEQSGIDLEPILPDEYKGLPNNVLVVTRDTLNDPERLDEAIALAAGWFKGTGFASTDREGALSAICEVVPADCQDMAVAESLFDTAIGLEKEQADAAGEHDLPKFELIRDVIVDSSTLGEQEIDVAALFSNDYVDDIRKSMN
jgi:NitT/TauT family transport system substrate-binding protein